MLPVNTLLKRRATSVVWRVLDEVASRETSDTTSTHYVMIDALSPKALPFLVGKLRFLDEIGSGEFIVVEEIIEVPNLISLSDYDKMLLERRWGLIKFTKRFGQRIWDKDYRGRLARRLSVFKIYSKPFFYDVLRLYWQRGQTKEALATNMWRCGGPGQPRIPAGDAPKPGRPRTIQPGIGVSATEEHRRNMRLAWASTPVGRDGRWLKSSWDWMLIKYYHEHISVEPKNDTSHKVQVKNYDRVPTFEQFEYHWKQEHAFHVRQLKRLQQRKFDLAFKPLLTGTLTEVRGPGTRYYIDATVLDVYVVSRLNRRRIVGRPTLYVVIDQFSRMIVGIYIGLEPPCWAGAMLAVWNCSVDKVSFCAEYGITITSELWPTGYMPLHLMGDRGELKSEDADRLSVGFGLDVENARGYAGEAKGVVERTFATLHTIFGPYMPGYIDKELAGRDQEPAVLRSAMTYDAIVRAVIAAVLTANTRVVRGYEGWPEVIADGVPFVPLSLWKWGVENLRSDVRKYSDIHLKKYLWPQAQMNVTKHGLKLYRGLYYMGEALRSQSWFAQALHEKTVVKALYHPLVTGSAIVLPSSAQGAVCNVTLTRKVHKWGGVSFSEVSALEHQKARQNASAPWETLPMRLGLTKQVIDDAAHQRRLAARAKLPGETKSERTENIRGNRDEEIRVMTAEAVSGGIGAGAYAVSISPDVPTAPITSEADAAEAQTANVVRNFFKARKPGPSADNS